MQNDCRHDRRRLLLSGLLLSPLLSPYLRAFAADHSAHDHGHHHEDHRQHMAMAASEEVKRSQAAYSVPALTLVRQDGAKASFPQAIDDGRPVLLNFIFTSCTTICPMTTQVFAKVQDKLAAANEKATLVSISIDPEYDTPKRLADYAKRFGAAGNWQFYTGSQAASIAMQKAFEAYRGDKMNHAPVTFLRAAPKKAWVRLDGFASPDEVLREYRRITVAA